MLEDETEVLKVAAFIDCSTTCTTLVTTLEGSEWEGVAEDDFMEDETNFDSLGAGLGWIETS